MYVGDRKCVVLQQRRTGSNKNARFGRPIQSIYRTQSAKYMHISGHRRLRMCIHRGWWIHLRLTPGIRRLITTIEELAQLNPILFLYQSVELNLINRENPGKW